MIVLQRRAITVPLPTNFLKKKTGVEDKVRKYCKGWYSEKIERITEKNSSTKSKNMLQLLRKTTFLLWFTECYVFF